MKKIIYYSILCFVFILLDLFISSILMLVGLFPFIISYAYSLGRSIAHPELLLLCLGITMLLRPLFYKIVFKESKKFDNGITYAIIGFSVILFLLPLVAYNLL